MSEEMKELIFEIKKSRKINTLMFDTLFGVLNINGLRNIKTLWEINLHGGDYGEYQSERNIKSIEVEIKDAYKELEKSVIYHQEITRHKYVPDLKEELNPADESEAEILNNNNNITKEN